MYKLLLFCLLFFGCENSPTTYKKIYYLSEDSHFLCDKIHQGLTITGYNCTNTKSFILHDKVYGLTNVTELVITITE